MGWVVGFEPTYTGATTLGLDHLTIPTMLVNFVHYCVAVSLVLGYVHRYVPFGTHSTRLVLRKISCAYRFVNFVHYCAYRFVNFVQICFFQKRVGDLERARTVDLQRDRLAF